MWDKPFDRLRAFGLRVGNRVEGWRNGVTEVLRSGRELKAGTTD